ncbi:BMP-binding endothelial regulator protein-like [Saccoglossus kowalevskii]|uniref:IgGFc-binding protein-like n=1 Tax=Saccoglossus kowalevskii TaxID=10224 RepID=A0ABM0MB23_SACKO|nr:PREDICTED: IgGFc-binding protein-like [Saccoglossus kowalevskii]
MLRLLIILTIASFAVAASTERSIEKRSSKYEFVNEAVTWVDAKAACEAKNKKLAEIRSQADEDEAVAAVGGGGAAFWIGLVDLDGDLIFEYATGGSLTFTSWNTAPFQGGGQCVVDFSGLWRNSLCNDTRMMMPFICEPDPQVTGDPHLTTFDGRPFSFQGICWHTLFKDCSTNPAFEVTAEFEPREDSTLEHVRTRTVSVNVTVGDDFAIINGLDVVTGTTDGHVTAARPIHVQEDDKTVTLTFISKDTTFTLSWTLKKHSLRVSTSGSDYRGHLCGLLGNDDGDTLNDFTKPDGAVVHDAAEFGESWRVEWKKCD